MRRVGRRLAFQRVDLGLQIIPRQWMVPYIKPRKPAIPTERLSRAPYPSSPRDGHIRTAGRFRRLHALARLLRFNIQVSCRDWHSGTDMMGYFARNVRQLRTAPSNTTDAPTITS